MDLMTAELLNSKIIQYQDFKERLELQMYIIR